MTHKIRETLEGIELLMDLVDLSDTPIPEAYEAVLAQIEAGEVDPEADIDEVIEERKARAAGPPH
ncbi:MAG: hypothetical protein U0S49_05560 [Rhodospirillales bacterium]|nr:hypothetical protein [Rhodospirillales bacterium]